MDIMGGMQVDVYDSMAVGVQNAACIVACMSAAYQSSENCKLELKFGRQLGTPIVPVRPEPIKIGLLIRCTVRGVKARTVRSGSRRTATGAPRTGSASSPRAWSPAGIICA
jgi:hypothetical protein